MRVGAVTTLSKDAERNMAPDNLIAWKVDPTILPAAAKLETERAFDPALSPDPVKARAASEDAAFAAN